MPPASAILALLLLASVGPHSRAAETNAPPPDSGRQIGHSVLEKADDRPFTVTNGTRRVDANSDLIVSFRTLTSVAAAEASPEWTRLTNVLAGVGQAFAERAALRERLKNIDLADANAVAELTNANHAFSLRTEAWLQQWQDALGFGNDDAAFQRILSGRFDGQGTPRQPYSNLSRYVRKELERVNQAALGWIDTRSAQVTVQAFHSPIGGARRAVHVEGYDTIPAGELQPIDRTGLRLTPAEQARLAMEVKMSEQAAKSLREIRKSGGEISAMTHQFLTQFSARLTTLEQTLKEGPAAWSNALSNNTLLQPLRVLAQNATATNTQSAANTVLTNLESFKVDLGLLQPLVSQVQAIRSLLALDGNSSLGQVLLGTGNLRMQANLFSNSVAVLTGRVTNWPARVVAISTGLDELGSALTAAEKQAFLPEEVREFVNGVSTQFPETLRALGLIGSIFTDPDVTQGAETLASANVEPIWRDQSNLVDGIVELSRVGLTQGDEMMVKVSYRQRATNGAPASLLSEDTYKVDAVLMGFHREFGASVIFARGLRDGEEEWRPNVAAHVHWFYRYRKESGAWRKSWNFVNPGLGLHMASLDQGDDSVEIGMGVNASFFDGVVVGGLGFNLTNDQHPYAFVGLSLLDLLESAKKLKR
jgi:hypothetical protein